MVLTQRRRGRETVERERTVRHVFVGFVERKEFGIGNAEFETLLMSPVGAYCIVLYFLY